MTRFMARHPVLAGCVLMLGHLAFLAVQSVMLYVCARAALYAPDSWIVRLFSASEWPVNGLLVFAVACWLALLRRRSGQSAWPVCWLALTAPVQIWLHMMALALGSTVVLGGMGALVRLTDFEWCARWFMQRSNYVAVPAALLGVLAGADSR